MLSKVKTLLIRFGNDLYPNEIEPFRGAVNRVVSGENVLFHNHLGED